MTDLSGYRVMVVEDLFYLAMDVKAALHGAGATVVGPFSNAAAALSSLADTEPSCAVLDVNLGEGASFDVARALRKRDVPFLFFTGYDPLAIPAEFADVSRLEKPVEPDQILDAVKDCIKSETTPR